MNISKKAAVRRLQLLLSMCLEVNYGKASITWWGADTFWGGTIEIDSLVLPGKNSYKILENKEIDVIRDNNREVSIFNRKLLEIYFLAEQELKGAKNSEERWEICQRSMKIFSEFSNIDLGARTRLIDSMIKLYLGDSYPYRAIPFFLVKVERSEKDHRATLVVEILGGISRSGRLMKDTVYLYISMPSEKHLTKWIDRLRSVILYNRQIILYIGINF